MKFGAKDTEICGMWGKECDHDGNGIVGAEDFNTLRACFGKNEHCM
jgi:hypothetical protein